MDDRDLERKWGVHFAMGGTGSIVKGLVRLIEGQGGTSALRADVAQIMLVGRRAAGVRLSSGEQIAADIVVSNADSAATYAQLLPESARRRWTDRKLRRARYSMSLFIWYFGTRRKYRGRAASHHPGGSTLSRIAARHLRSKGAGRGFQPVFAPADGHRTSLAPPGCDAFYVLSPVPHLGADVDWRARAEGYRQAIEQHLGATLLPEV